MGGRDVGRALEARQPDLPGGREPHAGRRSARRGVLNSEPLAPKWEAFGWHVQRVDGNDIPALVQAFDAARSLAEPKPRVIICDTKMAKGVPFLEAREKSHFLRVEQHEWAAGDRGTGRREEVMSRTKRAPWRGVAPEAQDPNKPRLTTSAMIASIAGAGPADQPGALRPCPGGAGQRPAPRSSA